MQQHRDLDISPSNTVHSWLAHVESGDVRNLVELHGSPLRPHRSDHRRMQIHSNAFNGGLPSGSQSFNEGLRLVGQSVLNSAKSPNRELAAEDGQNDGLQHDTIDPYNGKTYERKARRKTRPDRYELKDHARPVSRQTVEEDNGGSGLRKKRKKGGFARPGDNFKAPNVMQERLTLNSGFDKALFGRGRASAAVRRRDLPNLTFSEMGFLSKDSSQKHEAKPNSTKQKPERDAHSMAAISQYFAGEQERTNLKGLPDIRWQKVDHVHPSPSRITCVTRTASISIPPPETRQIRIPREPTAVGASIATPTTSPSAATSYYTWSGSNPSRTERPHPSYRRICLSGPSYSTRKPKSLTRQSGHVLTWKDVQNTDHVLSVEANGFCNDKPGDRIHKRRKNSCGNRRNYLTIAATSQNIPADAAHGDPENSAVQQRKTAATQTSPGLYIVREEATMDDVENQVEMDTSTHSIGRRSGPGGQSFNVGHQAENFGAGFDLGKMPIRGAGLENVLHFERDLEHALYDLEELVDITDGELLTNFPARFPHHETWATPSRGLGMRPLYHSINDCIPLSGSMERVHTRSLDQPPGTSDHKFPQQPFSRFMLPHVTPGLDRELAGRIDSITCVKRNLWTSPQRRFPGPAYRDGSICSRIGEIPGSQARHRRKYSLDSIEIPTLQRERTPALDSAETAGPSDELESTHSMGSRTAISEKSTFWRPNKLY